MKNILTTILLALGLTSAASMHAQDLFGGDCCFSDCDTGCNDGWYVGVVGGVNFIESPRARFTTTTGVTDSFRQHVRKGYLVGGAIGYKFANLPYFSSCSSNLSYRLEGEIAYRRNNLKRRDFTLPGIAAPAGDVSLGGFLSYTTYMVNGYVEWDPCWCLPISPYVGVGIGYADTHFRPKISSDLFSSFHGDHKKGRFAYQVIVGLNMPLSTCYKVDLGLEYRYFNTANSDHHSHDKRNISNNAACLTLRKYF